MICITIFFLYLDPDQSFLMRIRIQIRANDTDPTGSGSEILPTGIGFKESIRSKSICHKMHKVFILRLQIDNLDEMISEQNLCVRWPTSKLKVNQGFVVQKPQKKSFGTKKPINDIFCWTRCLSIYYSIIGLLINHLIFYFLIIVPYVETNACRPNVYL